MSEVIESNDVAVQPEQKYIVEAAKRRRPEGTKQFEQLHFSDNDRLRSLADDPWADHAKLNTLPLPFIDGDRVKFLITGAGMGGVIMAIKLIKSGFSTKQIMIVEAAGGVGGTWYWNRYPGLHCKIYVPDCYYRGTNTSLPNQATLNLTAICPSWKRPDICLSRSMVLAWRFEFIWNA